MAPREFQATMWRELLPKPTTAVSIKKAIVSSHFSIVFEAEPWQIMQSALSAQQPKSQTLCQ